AAHRAGVATPRVEFIFDEADGLGEGFVSAFQPGETLGQRIVRDAALADARQNMTGQCAALLATIHGMATESLPPLPADSPGAMVDKLFATHKRYATRLPVFDVAFRYLRDTLPPHSGAPRLVHGDFRNGN